MDSDEGTFFAYLRSGTVRRIPLSREIQKKLTRRFRNKAKAYIPEDDTLIIRFQKNPTYKPNRDERFVIEDFYLPNAVESALYNPLTAGIIKKMSTMR